MSSKHQMIKDYIIDILISILGSAIVGAALAVFTVPNDIAPGGVSGLATALAYITPVKVGVWTLIINLPLLIAAWKKLGLRSLVFTLLCTVLLSFFIDYTTVYLPVYTNNILLASIFGGVFSGFGIGLLFLRGISTGGTDLAALIMRKYLPNIPLGTLLLFADAAVVVIAVCIFRDIEVALYSSITIFVSSKVIDAMAQGVDYAKVIYVVTDKAYEMCDVLNVTTERGTTIFAVTGGYTKEPKQMVMTVTRRGVLAQTLKLIRQVDPKAFTFVVDSTEVHGEGFKIDT